MSKQVTLTEDDLDWLTRVKTRMVRLRKREAAHTDLLAAEMMTVIVWIHAIRRGLQARFQHEIDSDL